MPSRVPPGDSTLAALIAVDAICGWRRCSHTLPCATVRFILSHASCAVAICGWMRYSHVCRAPPLMLMCQLRC